VQIIQLFDANRHITDHQSGIAYLKRRLVSMHVLFNYIYR